MRVWQAGSFIATTAESAQLTGYDFSAVAPSPVPLLTVSAPLGLNLGAAPGAIVNQSVAGGVGLTVNPLESLVLIGGEIALPGGIITALDGQVQLSAVGDVPVSLADTPVGWQVSYPTLDPANQGEISLSSQAAIQLVNMLGNPLSHVTLVGGLITLAEQSTLLSTNSSALPGGNIVIDAAHLSLVDGGQAIARTESDGAGGNIIARVPGRTHMTRSNNATDNVLLSETVSTGRAGDINLQTGELLLEHNSGIFNRSANFAAGDGGDVVISASEAVRGQSPTGALGGIVLASQGSGNAGNLTLTTPLLSLSGRQVISNVSFLSGQGGDIDIVADQVVLNGPSSLASDFLRAPEIIAYAYGAGDGGDLNVMAQQLTLRHGSLLQSVSINDRDGALRLLTAVDPSLVDLIGLPDAGIGDAGNVSVVADTIVLDGFNPFSPSLPSQISSLALGRGNAGDVAVVTGALTLSQGAGLVSTGLFGPVATTSQLQSTSGLGDGGNLSVVADDITVTGVNPMTELSSVLGTQTGSFGDAGDTVIDTQRLTVLDGGSVTSGTLTSGNGGQLTINAHESILVSGGHASGQPSTIGTFALEPSEALRQAFFLPAIPEGDTGQLTMTTPRLDIRDGGEVGVAHQGIGNAGELRIDADTLRLADQAQITATTVSGQGGNIELQTEDLLLLRRGSRITASALGGMGDGGNLSIDAGIVLAVSHENSDVIANAVGGRGGQVAIATPTLLGLTPRDRLTPNSDITASSGIGLNGMVQIDTSLVASPNTPEGLPNQPTDDSQQLRAACLAFAGASFITSGRGGVPVMPTATLPGVVLVEDWRQAVSTSTLTSAPPRATSSHWVEAQGWHRNAQGQVELLSPPTGNVATAVQACHSSASAPPSMPVLVNANTPAP
ncbi:MAG: S-layer family protein [Cyanobacteria bacterium P01_A01_bin.105]